MLRQRAHLGGMTKRATQRPAPFKKPDYWDNSPAPKPQAKNAQASENDPEGLSPTRYGDWVKDGIAVDF